MTPQKWDYLVVNLVRSYGMNYRANGMKMAEWKDLPLHDMLARVGQQGYELVAYDGANYIFKRPAMPRNATQPMTGSAPRPLGPRPPTGPLPSAPRSEGDTLPPPPAPRSPET
jgi:hypothetical protein